MAVIPLHAATDGLIRAVVPKIDSLVIGTRGLLWDSGDVPGPQPEPKPPVLPGGGGGKPYKGKKKGVLWEDEVRTVKTREDEEILVIIKAFTQCQ